MTRPVRYTVDEAIESLRDIVTAGSSSRPSLDDDAGGTFRRVELDDFCFHDGSSHVSFRPKRRVRERRRREYA